MTPTVYRYSRGGVGGVQVFSQQSAVTKLQTLFPRVQLFPNDQHVAVVQVVHRLRDARSLIWRRPTHDKTRESPVAQRELINTFSGLFAGLLWQESTHVR